MIGAANSLPWCRTRRARRFLGPLRHAAVTFFGGDVLDATHHGPALDERIENRREAVAGATALTKDKTGWRRWLPMLGAALLAATLAVGAVLVAVLMAFLGGGSHKQHRGRRGRPRGVD